jgi:hypothetical protein
MPPAPPAPAAASASSGCGNLGLRKDGSDVPGDQVAVTGAAADLDVPAVALEYSTTRPVAPVTGGSDPAFSPD